VVTNSGGIEGIYTAILKINDFVESQEEVSIGASKSETVTFSISKNKPGTYSVNIDGELGQFSVIVPSTTNWGLISGIIACCVVIAGLLLYFIVLWKRSTQKSS
jgi:hypothetical protein